MTTFILDPAVHTTACVPRSFRPPPRRQYRDKQYQGGETEWQQRLAKSTTVYVGNLSCYTTEYQIYELFSRCGSIKRIIMGLDKFKKTPCGFCFVEFDERESALRCCTFLNKNLLDNRELQIDIDAGFKEGRQFGRGSHGGQIGDERRREREQQRPVEGSGNGPVGGRGRPGSPSTIMTRSITIVACMAIFLAILHIPQPAESSFVILSSSSANQLQYVNTANIRKLQSSDTRGQFEKNFANFLVNLLKTAKPTLLQAFIKATLADKQLREIAIGLFFSNNSTDEPEK